MSPNAYQKLLSVKPLEVAEYKGSAYYFASWVDDVGRLVRRRIMIQALPSDPARRRNECNYIARRLAVALAKPQDQIADAIECGEILLDEALAIQIANHVRSVYMAERNDELNARSLLSGEELDDLAWHADFPRPVVAKFIQKVCRSIAIRQLGIPADQVAPKSGLDVFIEKVGLATREVHRILDDPDRATVAFSTVDKICCNSEFLIEDFIRDAMDWAERKGDWSDRPGLADPYPVGRLYTSSRSSALLDDDWLI